jgi:hypothetical protein
MKKYLLLALSAVMALLSTSCFEHTATIRLEKDGSGTITEETLLGDQASAMLAQLPAQGGKDPLSMLSDKASAEKSAAKMGEGVTVEKAEKIDGAQKGGRIVYHFTDINKVKYSFGKSLSSAAQSMNPAGAEEKESDDPISFTYAGGKLTLKMPNPKLDPAKAKEKAEAAAQIGPEQLGAMKGAFKDMSMGLKLVVAPGIDKSTASHVDGNTVTLMEMKFAKLVEDPDKFLKFVKSQPETPAEMQKALEGVEGVKLETKEEVTVDVK